MFITNLDLSRKSLCLKLTAINVPLLYTNDTGRLTHVSVLLLMT